MYFLAKITSVKSNISTVGRKSPKLVWLEKLLECLTVLVLLLSTVFHSSQRELDNFVDSPMFLLSKSVEFWC
jgi:hypothetical protein